MRLVHKTDIDKSVLELVELANVDSPFASQLVNRYCRRLARRMYRSGKIDYSTAKHLCRNFTR